jgi:glyoxylase-like metal-dependent hydrolase (beta-lactamase superfamily II)
MAAGRIELWMPTSSTLQLLDGTRSFADAASLGPSGPAGPPAVEPDPAAGVVRVHVQGAGGVPGRRGVTTLVGERSIVVVDPGDPSEEALAAVLGAVASRGARIRAVALTSADPGVSAGAEHLALGTGVPVLARAAAARRLACDVTVVAPGDVIGDGDVVVRVLDGAPGRADALRYRVGDAGVELG